MPLRVLQRCVFQRILRFRLPHSSSFPSRLARLRLSSLVSTQQSDSSPPLPPASPAICTSVRHTPSSTTMPAASSSRTSFCGKRAPPLAMATATVVRLLLCPLLPLQLSRHPHRAHRADLLAQAAEEAEEARTTERQASLTHSSLLPSQPLHYSS